MCEHLQMSACVCRVWQGVQVHWCLDYHRSHWEFWVCFVCGVLCAVCEEFTFRFELFPKGECKFSALTHACSPPLQVKLLSTIRQVLNTLY